MTRKSRAWILALAAAALCAAGWQRPARAYIDLAPTLPKVISDAPTICEVECASFDAKTNTLTLKPTRAIKGTLPESIVAHSLAPESGAVPGQILRWAVKGNKAVMFSSARTSLVCVGTTWYQVKLVVGAGGQWKMDKDRPDLSMSYFGSVARLESAISTILSGQSAVITAVAYNTDSQGAMFDLALNRMALPELVRVDRYCASTAMPPTVSGAGSSPAFYIGPGAADPEDVPALLEKLTSKEAGERQDAAEDLRRLGTHARPAVQALRGLLKDDDAAVRFAAAAAVYRITGDVSVLEIISTGLESKDAAAQRAAVHEAGFAAGDGSGLAAKLIPFLEKEDVSLKLTALESLSMLGPQAAAAVPALIKMLDTPAYTIDVADALGRIGPAARPAVARLLPLLTSEQANVRWAAVRGLAQMGGMEAHPVVDFLVKSMSAATEVEGYNMMIYFALLGPVAQDATEKIQNFHVKNPGLPRATLWALAPEKAYPWEQLSLFGMMGGPGGGPPGGGAMPGAPGTMPMGFPTTGPASMPAMPGMGAGGNPWGAGWGGGGTSAEAGIGSGGGGITIDDGTNPFLHFMDYIFAAYIHELGTRLSPVVPKLAKGILEDKAGDVPPWGFKLLNADPETALQLLTPGLSSSELGIRERAALALGYMGTTALPAKPLLQAAHDKTRSESERRFLEWTLREVTEGE